VNIVERHSPILCLGFEYTPLFQQKSSTLLWKGLHEIGHPMGLGHPVQLLHLGCHSISFSNLNLIGLFNGMLRKRWRQIDNRLSFESEMRMTRVRCRCREYDVDEDVGSEM